MQEPLSKGREEPLYCDRVAKLSLNVRLNNEKLYHSSVRVSIMTTLVYY